METKAATEYPQAIFTVAHTDVRIMPFNNHGRTLRIVVRSNVAAHALQVHFSGRCASTPLPVGAASLALCDECGVLRPDTLVPLTVGGVLHFTLPPGENLVSDHIRFPIQPGNWFALNLYYPTNERVTSGNWVGSEALRSRPGNFSADLQLPGPGIVSRFARTAITTDMTVSVTSVSRIVAMGEAPGRVIGCFGDSVTQQGNWTTPLDKLLHHRYPGEISLCNLGISGNQLIGDSPPALGRLNGIPGMLRFEYDLLELPGLTHAVLALGANDVGLPGSHGMPDEVITTGEYTTAMCSLADRLHQKGVFVLAATITPRTYTRPFNAQREALRQEWNSWIRTADCFDAVLDFDAVLQRTDGKPGMKDGFALPDGLHPSPIGGLHMAKSIDLSLFGNTTQ